jgi:uncharacterized membrane protein
MKKLWLKISDYSGVVFSLLAGGLGFLAGVVVVPGLTEFLTALSSLCYALAFGSLFTNNQIFASLLQHNKLKFSENEDVKKQRFRFIKQNKYIIAIGLIAAALVFASIFVPVLNVVSTWLFAVSNFYEAKAQLAKEKAYEKKLDTIDDPRVHEIYRERYFEKRRQAQFTTTMVVLSVTSAVITTIVFFVPVAAPIAYAVMGVIVIGLGILAAQFFIRSKIHAYKSYKLSKKLDEAEEMASFERTVSPKVNERKTCESDVQRGNDDQNSLRNNHSVTQNRFSFYSQPDNKPISNESEQDLSYQPTL